MTQKTQYFNPITGQEDHTAHNSNQNDNYRDCDELVPLMVNNPEPLSYTPYDDDDNENLIIEQDNRYKRTRWIKLTIVLIIVFIVGFFSWDSFRFFSNIDINLNNVDITGFTNDSIVLNLNLTADIQYKSYLLGIGDGGMNFDVIEPIIITENDDKLELLRITLPEQNNWISFKNGGTWQYNNISIKVNETLVTSVNKLFNSKEDLKVRIETKTSFFNLKKLKWKINKNIRIEKGNISSIVQKIINTTAFHALHIDGYDNNQISGVGKAKLMKNKDLSFITNFQVPKYGWNINIKINDTEINLMKIMTEHCKIDFNKQVDVLFNFEILNIDEKLIDENKNKNMIDLILSSYFNGKLINIWVTADRDHKPENVPKWMMHFFNHLDITLPISLKTFKEELNGFELIEKLDIDKIGISVDKDDNLILNGDIETKLNWNLFDVNFESKGNASIDGGEFEVNQIKSTINADGSSKSKIESVFKVQDVEIIRNIVQKVVDGFGLDNLNVDLNLKIFNVKSNFINGNFNVNNNFTINDYGKEFLNVNDSEISISLEEIELLEASNTNLSLLITTNVTVESFPSIENEVETIGFSIQYNGTMIGEVLIDRFKLIKNEPSLLKLIFNVKGESIQGKSKLEEFLGKFLSRVKNDIVISGIENFKSIGGSKTLSEILYGLSMPITVPQFGHGDDSIFLIDSTMHVMTKELELTVFNPIINRHIILDILQATASYEGTLIGYITKKIELTIPPGVYKTPRIPVTYATNGIGKDILLGAINGDLKVDSKALVKVGIGSFGMTILYSGSGMESKIRW